MNRFKTTGGAKGTWFKTSSALVFAVLTSVAAAGGLFDRRLGMFVHWGIYAVDGWHEQQQMRMHMTRDEYARRVAGFGAERFDAEALVSAAESMGATYLVFTAKHHDGFCLWDTKTTDFGVMNAPCGRDLLKEVADACARRGMRLGLYYSNPDWHHPNAYNPRSSHQLDAPNPGDEPDIPRYVEYVKAQVAELCTNYGKLCCLFWDIPPKYDVPELNALVRRLQPGIEINDRGWGTGDYSTPERGVPEGSAFPGKTEACDSVDAESWGFRANADYHTVGYLTRAIDRTLSMGGNFLLNVGPRADGRLTDEATALLRQVGEWHARVAESYRDVTTVTNVVADPRCIVTRRGRTTYVHYPKGLDRRGVDLSPIGELPTSVVLLNTGRPLPFELVPMPRSYLALRRACLHVSGIPADELANESVVLRLDFAQADL